MPQANDERVYIIVGRDAAFQGFIKASSRTAAIKKLEALGFIDSRVCDNTIPQYEGSR